MITDPIPDHPYGLNEHDGTVYRVDNPEQARIDVGKVVDSLLYRGLTERIAGTEIRRVYADTRSIAYTKHIAELAAEMAILHILHNSQPIEMPTHLSNLNAMTLAWRVMRPVEFDADFIARKH